MPIFEYRCPECDTEFEKLLRDQGKVECPECGCHEPKKLFSVFGVKSGDKFTASTASSCDACTASSCKGCTA